MTDRVHNFSAGPCTLPLSVLEEGQAEFVNYHGAGMSLIEMSHRGKQFVAVHEEAVDLVRTVFGVPDEFDVLFLQGGATLQFAMVPMNLLGSGQKAGYINSGTWAKGALADAKHYGDVYTAWDGADCNYTRMPSTDEIEIQPDSRYLHLTSNETIGGIRFSDWPQVGVPLIADMSSDYMSRPIPWERFDLVYGGAQKNLGPAGMALVIIRKTVARENNQEIGRYLRYDIQADKGSMFNTPPVFPIYMLGKVLRWMRDQGGVAAMERQAEEKAGMLYDAIDGSGGYYRCPVDTGSRSVMNVVFRLPNEELEKTFLSEADAAGLLNLKGHRSVGGIRASIYNAMPSEGVEALSTFMSDFQSAHPV
ncbi:MAG: 3-phosphoserine/phosphohydroxythreonine transaminase [Pseudomonadota bacterium]|nr:3-phosphoserine/phosphohydroxythreonine transaminase [Pseudomonadota bacterium]